MTKPKSPRGRPVTNTRLHELIAIYKCSRTWAYVLLRREKSIARATRISKAELKYLQKVGVVV